MKFLPSVLLGLALLLGVVPAFAQDEPEELVTIQLPSNSAQEVANYYQVLTGKNLILDNNLAGPPLTIEVKEAIPKSEAAAIIEATLILNGYTLVPVDANTSKLLGPSKFARTESVTLYTDRSQLPDTDQIVSYFMPLTYISNTDATNLFLQYVQPRPFGNIVAVPNINAVVITENTPAVRRLIDLKDQIDRPGARTVTEFFPLVRANAENVAETLDKILNSESTQNTGPGNRASNLQPSAPTTAPGGEEGAPPPQGQPGGIVSAVAEKIKIIADTRTNRVIVVAPEGEIAFIEGLVTDLDAGVEFEEPLKRPLRFAKAAEVLPVLANLLSEGGDEEQQSSSTAGGTNSTNNTDSGFGGSTGGGGEGISGTPDLLQDPNESTAPESVVVGKSRIIADRASNQIIVIGPPESRSKAANVLDMLDQQPKQVYLAVIIGQLRLGKGIEFGIDYLMRFGDVRILGQGTTGNVRNLLNNRNASIDLVPGTDEIVDAAADVAQVALPAASGLTVFGTIADSVDILARALGTDDRFQVISRPVIYTVNNKKAVILSGTEQPVPTSTLSSLNQNNSAVDTNTAVTSNIDFKDVVLKLEVVPLINSDNEVTLQIAQRNDNVQGSQNIAGNDIPIIATQQLQTTVTVPNRHTIVLGGLITDEESRAATGIPFLKDIPGLGYLFSSTTKNKIRRELIVMIQPFIINNRTDLQEVNYIERSNVSFREGLFDKPVEIRSAELPPPEEVRIGR